MLAAHDRQAQPIGLHHLKHRRLSTFLPAAQQGAPRSIGRAQRRQETEREGL